MSKRGDDGGGTWWRAAGQGAVAALALCLAAVAARGQAGNVASWYGFDGGSRAECWTPVLVEIPQGFTGGGFDGLAAIDPSAGCGAQRGRFTLPVVLTAAEGGAVAEVQRRWLYVRPGAGLLRAGAYLAGPGGERHELFADRVLARASFRDHTVVIVEAGASLGLADVVASRVALDDGSEHWPYSEQYDTARCTIARLPDRAIGYEAVDVLVLVNPEVVSDLRGDQVEAIAGFVATGGRLVVVVGRPGQVPGESRLGALLPARPAGVSVLSDVAALQRFAGPDASAPSGEVTVVAMTPKAGSRVRLSAGGTAVVVEGSVGMGSVTVVGLDVAGAIRGWPDLGRFAAALLRLEPQTSPEDTWTPCGQAMQRSVAPGSVSVMFFWAALGMMGVYIVAIGPVLYLVLKARGARRWSWPLCLVLSVAVAAGCFGVVSAVRNRRVRDASLTVVDYAPGAAPVSGRTWRCTQFPDSALYEVRIRAGVGYVAPIPMAGFSRRILSTGERLFDYAVTLMGVEDLPVKSNQFRSFASRWRSDGALPVSASVRRRGSGFAGTLTPARAVRRAVLIGRENTRVFDEGLAAGEAAAVDGGARTMATSRYLRELAEEVLESDRRFSMGLPATGGASGGASAGKEIFTEVCLSTCAELYRRRPAAGPGGRGRLQLLRNGWTRPLDLTHLLDLGYALLIGEADLDVPDGILVDGREPDERVRRVVFRQVVRIGPAEATAR